MGVCVCDHFSILRTSACRHLCYLLVHVGDAGPVRPLCWLEVCAGMEKTSKGSAAELRDLRYVLILSEIILETVYILDSCA
jgi:hypothetical protein